MSRWVVVLGLIAACGGTAADDPCIEEVELTPCRWNGVAGACLEGVCTATECGNGIEEPGEECDQGPDGGRNGCRSDCTNAECSDGIRDASEECDDSNKLANDGCSRDCQVERTSWHLVENRPRARKQAMMGYDAGRGVAVMVGGLGAESALAETWEWDGTRWSRRPVVPPVLGGHMVFDPRSGKLLVLTPDRSRIREYDGQRWSETFVPSRGPLASNFAVAWSGTRNTIVAVGLSIDGLETFDLDWNDGDRRYEQWSARPIVDVSVPSDRVEYALVGDALRGPTILFSGRPVGSSNAIDDAWTLDGNGWTPLPASGAPSSTATGVFDPVTGKVLFYDGTTLSSWDGTRWSRIDAPGAPSPRKDVAVTYDVRRRAVVVFGGRFADGSLSNETYTFDGAWHLHTPAPDVVEMPGATAAWDAARGTGLVVGEKTWRWNGTFEEVPGPGPMPRTRPALAAVRDRLILTGGAATADTWEWTGAWQQLSTLGAPVLGSAAMAPDPLGLVLFGDGETWLWRNNAWTRSTASSPATSASALTYHPIHMRTVLNGADGTWEWDGAAWSASSPAGSPSGGTVYDAWHRGILALGARRASVYGTAAWREVPSGISVVGPVAPPVAMFYDSIRRAVIYLEPQFLAIRAWEVRYDPIARESCSPALDSDFDGLAGCADPDCWGRCAPFCPPNAPCDTTLPRCGDGVCNSALESCELCPQDCQCPTLCGDYRCDLGEQCLGDCGP